MTVLRWPDLSSYLAARTVMATTPGWTEQLAWQRGARRPSSATGMALDVAWVIVNSGLHHRVAEGIYRRVQDALLGGIDLTEREFGHPGKRAAIQVVWNARAMLFECLGAAQTDTEVLTFCQSLPWIGPITKYHLAKNWGLQVAKPDRWLDRLAAHSGETVQGLCERLSAASGDPVAVVDLVLWWSCANQVLLIPDEETSPDDV